MNKIWTVILSLIAVFSFGAIPVFAHSVVTPNQVGIGATQTFTLTVPTEKDSPTTSVKLMIPAGLNFVTPVVQSGWTASAKTGPIPSGMTPPKAADGDLADSVVTEIDWNGGSIPQDQKALFLFSAQVPSQVGELDWKVEQGFSDGSTVSWNLGPNDPQPKDSEGNSDFDSAGPYSKTMIINDLTDSSTSPAITNKDTIISKSSENGLWFVSVLGLILATVSLGLQIRKK